MYRENLNSAIFVEKIFFLVKSVVNDDDPLPFTINGKAMLAL